MTAENDHIRIEALIRRWQKAVREGNRSALRADHDPSVVAFDTAPPLRIAGLDAYMAAWEAFFSAWSDLRRFEITELQIVNGVEVAFATALGVCEGIAPGGAQQSLEFFLTFGLRKADARWRIVHEHRSLPSAWLGRAIPTVGASG